MSNQIDIKELHWLLTVTQNIDVGIVVLDRDYRVGLEYVHGKPLRRGAV